MRALMMPRKKLSPSFLFSSIVSAFSCITSLRIALRFPSFLPYPSRIGSKTHLGSLPIGLSPSRPRAGRFPGLHIPRCAVRGAFPGAGTDKTKRPHPNFSTIWPIHKGPTALAVSVSNSRLVPLSDKSNSKFGLWPQFMDRHPHLLLPKQGALLALREE